MSITSKEEVIASVDASMDEVWALESLSKLREVARTKQWITVDDLWAVIDSPVGDKAKVGAIMRRAASNNLDKNPNGSFLKPTPYRVYSERGNHDNVVLWESKIFFSGDQTMPEVATLHADPSLDLNSMIRVYRAAKELYDSDFSDDKVSFVIEAIRSEFGQD